MSTFTASSIIIFYNFSITLQKSRPLPTIMLPNS
jgi:hypothetical protein